MIRSNFREKGLGVDHIGRGPHLLPVPFGVDPEILLGLFDRFFRHLDLFFRLMEEEKGIFHLEGDLIPDVGQDIRRLVFAAETGIHTIFCFSPFPEIPVRHRHDVPALLVPVGASGDARRVAVPRVVSDHTDVRVILASGQHDKALRLFQTEGIQPDLRAVLQGRGDAGVKRLLKGPVVQDVLNLDRGVDLPPENRVEFRFGHLHAVFRPDQELPAVRQLYLGVEQIVFGDDADVVKRLGRVPVGLQQFKGLPCHGEDPARLQDVEIGDLHLLDEILKRHRFFELCDIHPQAARLIVREDSAPGEEGLPRLDAPVVVFLGPGLVGARRDRH